MFQIFLLFQSARPPLTLICFLYSIIFFPPSVSHTHFFPSSLPSRSHSLYSLSFFPPLFLLHFLPPFHLPPPLTFPLRTLTSFIPLPPLLYSTPTHFFPDYTNLTILSLPASVLYVVVVLPVTSIPFSYLLPNMLPGVDFTGGRVYTMVAASSSSLPLFRLSLQFFVRFLLSFPPSLRLSITHPFRLPSFPSHSLNTHFNLSSFCHFLVFPSPLFHTDTHTRAHPFILVLPALIQV